MIAAAPSTRTPHRHLAAASLLLVLGILTTGAALLVTLRGADATRLAPWDAAAMVLLHVGTFAFVAVGALLVARRGSNPVGWLLCAYGVMLTNGLVAGTFLERIAGGQPLPGTQLVLWFGSWGWAVGLVTLGVLLVVFPDGRLPSPRWTWVGWIAAAALLCWTAVGVLLWPYRGPVLWAGGYPGRSAALATPGSVLVFAVLLAGVGALVTRYRRSNGDERLQVKWLAFAAAFLVAGVLAVVVTGTVPESNSTHPATLLLSAGILGIPLAVGVAVLRYRLYEIDRIISRTLGYALLSGVLVAVYLAGVVLLGALLRPVAGESELAVAGSTLAVAAVFGPLRRRVQDAVDRRFNRARYDAAKTVEAFRARLRQQIDLDELSADLLGVVGHTIEPATVGLWLRPGSARP